MYTYFYENIGYSANTIDVDAEGNSTVYGPLAHAVWNYGKGDYPRAQKGGNRFFVIEPTKKGNIVRAAQSKLETALPYMKHGMVLVSIQPMMALNGDKTMSKILTANSIKTGEKCYYDGHGFSLRPENAVYMAASRAQYLSELIGELYHIHIHIEDAPVKQE